MALFVAFLREPFLRADSWGALDVSGEVVGMPVSNSSWVSASSSFGAGTGAGVGAEIAGAGTEIAGARAETVRAGAETVRAGADTTGAGAETTGAGAGTGARGVDVVGSVRAIEGTAVATRTPALWAEGLVELS